MISPLAQKVIGVLSGPEVRRISFSLGGTSINKAATFQPVSIAIQSGKISVVQSQKPTVYSSTSNTLSLNPKDASAGADMEALIIHECTHAGCDLRKASLTVGYSEAVAFVAQCLFFYYKNEKVLKSGSAEPTFNDRILKEAWKVAMKVKEPSAVALSTADVQLLLNAIARHKNYKNTYSKQMIFDG